MRVKSESEVAQSCPTLLDPRAAHQAPLSMGSSKQAYWSGVPLPSLCSLVRAPQMLGDDLARRYAKAGALSLAVSMEGIFEAEREAVKGRESKSYIRTACFESLISSLLEIELSICTLIFSSVKWRYLGVNSICFMGWFQGSNEFIHVKHLELTWYRGSSQYQRTVKSLSCVQLFVTLDYSLSGCSVHGIF